MTEQSAQRAGTQVSRTIRAPRTAVYQACLDPDALAAWRVPDNMTARVHEFDARQGGAFRMTLTYGASEQSPGGDPADNPGGKPADNPGGDPADNPGGKTTEGTDTFQGRFLELVPDERIVELIEFESDDPSFAGEMRMTTTFSDAGDGTEVTVRCEDLPPGFRPADNQAGTEQALRKLAGLLTG